jgi:hypothetical protein
MDRLHADVDDLTALGRRGMKRCLEPFSARLPTVGSIREYYVDAEGLMSYGTDLADSYRRRPLPARLFDDVRELRVLQPQASTYLGENATGIEGRVRCGKRQHPVIFPPGLARLATGG